MHRPPKIAQLDDVLNKSKVYFVDDNIFGLDIAVDDLVRVQLSDCLTHLPHVACHFAFAHGVALLELFEQLSS